MQNQRRVFFIFIYLAIFVLVFCIYRPLYYTMDDKNVSLNESISDKILFKKKEDVKIKTILLWNSFFSSKNYGFGFGSEPFLKNNCSVTQCFVTDDKNYLPIKDFDAIVFHTPEFSFKQDFVLPKERSMKQLYVMYSMESPSKFPPTKVMDDFFNITVNYRLDSDIFHPYYHIFDKDNKNIAPDFEPAWLKPELCEKDVEDLMENVFNKKSKPVAWFVSNCHAKNKRLEYARELQNHINVDIIGACGNSTVCDRKDEKICFDMLKKEYFFYLSFENSNCVDYVTEKLYNAYTSHVIPVVMNGANMNSFGFPHSYLDVRNYASPMELANEMKALMNNSRRYIEYFWWKRYYSLTAKELHTPFCEICRMMHDDHWRPKDYLRLNYWMNGDAGKPICINN